jgi:hypothetical protein
MPPLMRQDHLFPSDLGTGLEWQNFESPTDSPDRYQPKLDRNTFSCFLKQDFT